MKLLNNKSTLILIVLLLIFCALFYLRYKNVLINEINVEDNRTDSSISALKRTSNKSIDKNTIQNLKKIISLMNLYKDIKTNEDKNENKSSIYYSVKGRIVLMEDGKPAKEIDLKDLRIKDISFRYNPPVKDIRVDKLLYFDEKMIKGSHHIAVNYRGKVAISVINIERDYEDLELYMSLNTYQDFANKYENMFNNCELIESINIIENTNTMTLERKCSVVGSVRSKTPFQYLSVIMTINEEYVEKNMDKMDNNFSENIIKDTVLNKNGEFAFYDILCECWYIYLFNRVEMKDCKFFNVCLSSGITNLFLEF